MKFEYDDKTFIGTRAEIIEELKSYLVRFTLFWNDDKHTWSLAGIYHYTECDPAQARRAIVDYIIKSVPEEKVAFQHMCFDNVTKFKDYLWSQEVRHLSDGVFSFCTFTEHFNTSMSLLEIKEALIKRVLDAI